MNVLMSVKEDDHQSNADLALRELKAARMLVKRQRARGVAALNELFRRGATPEPLPSGRYTGKMVAIDIAPGLTQLFEALLAWWMPWLGKTFDPLQQSGVNIFTQDSAPLARFFNPFYRGFVADKPGSYRGFTFRTYIAPGLVDSDRSVLKIDYDLKENSSLTVRRILDELVQLSDQLYLGKAHVRWWWRPAGAWQTVAYFSLSPE
jgi:hypothetical protein